MTDLDNRDLSTTRIWQEVDVWELIDNALENAGFPEGIGKVLYAYFDQALEQDHGNVITDMSLSERLHDLGVYLVDPEQPK